MKKSIFSKALALILCLLLAFSTFSVNVFAINEDADLDMGDDVIIGEKLSDVWLSSNGSDSNDGKTQSTPFKTLQKATYNVASGGTIHIVNTYTVDSNTVWSDKRPNADITITGGTLALSADLVIGSNATFKSITINGGKSLYANGKSVTFDTGVTATDATVYGGNKTGEALESTNITINGGTLGAVYGGSSVDCSIKQVNLIVNGGTINSIFGGNNASALTGDVTVQLLGGTFNDRIFGGCNNEYTYKSGYIGTIGASITWNTAYYVTGKVDVIVSEKASINTNNSSGKDKAFFAHSRHKTLSANENTTIIFLSSSAFNSNSSKLGTKTSKGNVGTSDTLAGAGMGTNTAASADSVHVHDTTADDTNDTITENCTAMTGTACSNSTTVTLTLKKVSLEYTGEEITPMVATVNGELKLGEPVITYSNNVNPGTATATMKYGDKTVSQNFTIEKQTPKAPTLVAVPESISGKADGEINGLTTEMEISTNNTDYTAVTDTTAKFAPGTYYVRYKETEFNKTSAATKVVIEAGRMLSVIFVANGETIASKSVSYGATITDIPEIPAKEGCDQVAPYWSVNDFTNITTDLTVEAIYSINTYTVKYVADGVVVSEQTVNYGEDATAPEVPAKEGCDQVAPYWDIEATNVTSDLTVNAVYTNNIYFVIFYVNGIEIDFIEIEHGATLTNIPKIPSRTGYDQVAPYWDVADFTNITSDLEVNAVYKINKYTVKYVIDGVVVSEQTVNHGASATAPEIPAKEGYTEIAPYWDIDAKNVKSDLTINAVYTKDLPKITPADTNNDGKVNLKDLITLAQYVAGWENTGAYLPALDIDGDNEIDLDDVNVLARYLAGWDEEISKVPYLG